jgi:hypothetical protein
MKSKQMHYELKLTENDDWIEVSEKFFLNQLADNFYPITPIIVKMLRGREVADSTASYRIIIHPGAKGIFIPDDRPITQSTLN